MTDRFAPPIELWDAKKCDRVLGCKNASAFLYRVNKGVFPAPHCYDGKALWNADEIRAALRKE